MEKMVCKYCGYEMEVESYGQCPKCRKNNPWTIAKNLDLDDLLLTFARQHGYQDWATNGCLPNWLKKEGLIDQWKEIEEKATNFDLIPPPRAMSKEELRDHFLVQVWPKWQEMDPIPRREFLESHPGLHKLAKAYVEYWANKGFELRKVVTGGKSIIFDPNEARRRDKELMQKVLRTGASFVSTGGSGEKLGTRRID